MDNYTKHNTKPINIIGKKTGYTENDIEIVYTKSFYEQWNYNIRQEYCGSYLISECKKQYILDCGEDHWKRELIRHMTHDGLAHWHHFYDSVGVSAELRKGPKPS